MSKLDELFLKARELADAAGSKAQEMAELAKLRLKASQMRSDLDANYLKLGEIIYELNKAGAQNEDLVNMCVAEIESQNQELEELNTKINSMKNVVKCPECMADNAVESLFCSRCGASLRTQTIVPSEPQPETTQEADQAVETSTIEQVDSETVEEENVE